MRTKLTFITIAVISALIVGTAFTARAQHAGLHMQVDSVKEGPIPGYGSESLTPRNGPTHESLQPIEAPMESVLYGEDDSWVQGNPELDLYNFDVEWGVAEGLTMKRNLSQKRVKAKGRPFDTGLRQTVTQSVQASPFTGMTLNFSEKHQETFDLADISLGATDTETMALHGDYGGGGTGGKINYKRTVQQKLKPEENTPFASNSIARTTTNEQLTVNQSIGELLGGDGTVEYVRKMHTVEKPQAYPEKQTTETVKLNTGMWDGVQVNALLGQSHANEQAGVHWQKRNLKMSKKVNAGKALVQFTDYDRRKNRTTTEKHSQKYQLPVEIGDHPVALNYTAKTTQKGTTLTAEKRTASIATALGGYDVNADWQRNFKRKGGTNIKKTKQSLQLPFDFLGEKASFTYNLTGKQADKEVQKKLRVAKLDLPLNALKQGTQFNYTVRGEKPKPNKPFVETRTAKLQVPMSLLDTPVRPEFTRITKRGPSGKTMKFISSMGAPVSVGGHKVQTQHRYAAINRPGGGEQNQLLTDLKIPTRPGAVQVKRVATTDIGPGGEETQSRVVNVVGPRVSLSPSVSAKADMQFKDLRQNTDHQRTHLNLKTQLFPGMELTGDYTMLDKGVRKDTKKRRLDTSYALSPRWQLNARYAETENLGQSSNIARTLVAQRKSSDPHDMHLRAAVSSVDKPGDDGELLQVIEGGFGDPKEFVAVNAKYQEYNEKKLKPLQEPVVQFNLKHNRPGSLRLAAEYTDSKKWPHPHRDYTIGFPMGESSLQLRYAQNTKDPMDPKHKQVRVGKTYDADLESKVFNDVNLNLTYRYFDSPNSTWDQECNDQWMRMQLAGGKPQRGGAIKLTYSSGDFVDLVKKHPEKTPSSKLSLEYEKRWGEKDDRKLTLQMHRTTMPDTIDSLEDSYEGRMKFDYRF